MIGLDSDYAQVSSVLGENTALYGPGGENIPEIVNSVGEGLRIKKMGIYGWCIHNADVVEFLSRSKQLQIQWIRNGRMGMEFWLRLIENFEIGRVPSNRVMWDKEMKFALHMGFVRVVKFEVKAAWECDQAYEPTKEGLAFYRHLKSGLESLFRSSV